MNQVTQLRQQQVNPEIYEDECPEGLVVFVMSELLPDMAFNWPGGASKIERDLEIAARSYARQLFGRGFTPVLIREALQLEIESGRDYMPKPIELANRCRSLIQLSGKASVKRVISPAAIRMMAESKAWASGQPVSSSLIEMEINKITLSYKDQGVEIGGAW